MNAHEPIIAGTPKSDTQQASTQDVAALAALKPAAGAIPRPRPIRAVLLL